ncbi:MAG TPA: transcriptional regulator, partial [Rummeliibacillus sp.]|nr:transcriptional regulator [Rummeliibacillus sp.]
SLLLELYENFNQTRHSVVEGSEPLKEMYGKFPQFLELIALIRNIYGDDFMDIFEDSLRNIED